MSRLCALAAACAALAASPPSLPQEDPPPPIARVSAEPLPTIVLVMADDQGWGDIGLRDDDVHTPQLDRLFREGVELTRFYAAAPVCSPTRASVLTGRHPARMGIDGANDGHLPRAEVNLAERLGACGYRTGFFGKWHLGTLTREVVDSNRGGREKHAAHHSPPWEHGFDVSFATEAKVPTFDPMKKPGSDEPYGTRYWTGPGEVVDAKELGGDDSALIVERAVAFLDEARKAGEPALAVVWLHAPHEPVVASPARIDELELDAGTGRGRYLSCLADIDRQVGALRDTLEADETRPAVLMYCSDNGPEHQRGPGSTGGLRGRKRDLLEGGVRVPAAIWWNGGAERATYRGLERGASTGEPSTTSDLLPTALDLARVESKVEGGDGASLVARFSGTAPPPWGGYGFRSKRKRAFVRGRWKAHSADAGETWALYDVDADAGETTDRAADEPTTLAELVRAFESWQDDVLKDREDAPEASR